ncbi:MAG: GAF domain-containing protein [Sphingomonadales bacterium]|jgi:GAF domain-containing protein
MSFFAPALAGTKPEQYVQLAEQLRLLIGDERDFVANMANMSALLFHQLGDLNWAGFYLKRDGGLVLGPFQGKPACIRIPLGRGVCGTAAATHETQVVPDVHAFPGHIACDADSRSEIVVPLIHEGALIGVLDLDSPKPGRFDEDDRAGLEAAAGLLLRASNLN